MSDSDKSDLLPGESSVLERIAADYPGAGELYMRNGYAEAVGHVRAVYGRGTTEQHRRQGGIFICCVGSPRWKQFAS